MFGATKPREDSELLGSKEQKEERQSEEEMEAEKHYKADGFCDHMAKDLPLRYLIIVGVQFGFAFSSLLGGFQLDFLCTLFAIGFFVFKTFTAHSGNLPPWWRRLRDPKAELLTKLKTFVEVPLWLFGDILDTKLDKINVYRMLGLYTNFTISTASFFATASQTSVAAALPCLVAFDFLRDIFKREVVS
jgi:hypothetical protein